MAGKALKEYYEILDGSRKAKYLKSKNVSVSYDCASPSEELWKIHAEGLRVSSEKNQTLLDLKSELAGRMLQSCHLCEHQCGKNRAHGIRGHCGVLRPRISSDFLHLGEEPDLVPSYTVFFAGCTFNCVFCQNWDISTNPEGGEEVPHSAMAARIERQAGIEGKRMGRAKNVNWVGGEPTPNLPYILEVLNRCSANLPQVWNSNMYMSEEAMNLLDGIVDVYLTDFKYGNDRCALRLSNVHDYMRVVERNHLRARASGEMIIRHLVLPSHTECCTRPALTWIAEYLKDVKVNVMAQYRPEYRAREFPDIARALSMKEYESAIGIAEELGLDLCD